MAIRPAIAPYGWSIALHLALAGLLFLGLQLPQPDAPKMPLPIDAVIVDQAVLQAASRQRREDDRQRAEARRREEAAARAERAEAERVEREATERRQQEEQRLAAEQAEQKKAQAAADARRRAEADAKRKAEQEAAARAADEARLRQEREADLRARLAEEEQRTSAGFQSLKADYVRAIQAHVEQRWFEPPGTNEGLSCTVFVTQIPGGEVVGMRFGACNGSAALRQSIETAVRNASPLPPPPEPSLFEREVRLIFTPKELKR